MKKVLLFTALAAALTAGFAQANEKLVVAATPIPHAEILVCRPDGSVTDDEESGELVHAGPLVAKGYWQDAERTAQRFKAAPAASRYGGTAVWSGDTVRRDADGLLYFVGRDRLA